MNGKQYVGQTIQTLQARWKRHCWESTQNRAAMAITRAIAKYGSESFLLEELERCPLETLDARECYWIETLSTLSPGGYNLSPGGGARHSLSAEARARISAANTGRKASPETLEKLRVSHLGQKHSPEQRAKASARLKGVRASDACYEAAAKALAKTYRLLSPNQEVVVFTNMAKFCREQGYNRARMNELANGKRDSYRGWTRIAKEGAPCS